MTGKPSPAARPDTRVTGREPVPFETRRLQPNGEQAWDFVINAWLMSVTDPKASGDMSRAPTSGMRLDSGRAFITQALQTSDALMAHWPGDPDHYLGFVCYRGDVVHYVYVKHPFRRRGLGSALLELAAKDAREVFTTCSLRLGLFRKPGRRITFNPALIFGGP